MDGAPETNTEKQPLKFPVEENVTSSVVGLMGSRLSGVPALATVSGLGVRVTVATFTNIVRVCVTPLPVAVRVTVPGPPGASGGAKSPVKKLVNGSSCPSTKTSMLLTPVSMPGVGVNETVIVPVKPFSGVILKNGNSGEPPAFNVIGFADVSPGEDSKVNSKVGVPTLIKNSDSLCSDPLTPRTKTKTGPIVSEPAAALKEKEAVTVVPPLRSTV